MGAGARGAMEAADQERSIVGSPMLQKRAPGKSLEYSAPSTHPQIAVARFEKHSDAEETLRTLNILPESSMVCAKPFLQFLLGSTCTPQEHLGFISGNTSDSPSKHLGFSKGFPFRAFISLQTKDTNSHISSVAPDGSRQCSQRHSAVQTGIPRACKS